MFLYAFYMFVKHFFFLHLFFHHYTIFIRVSVTKYNLQVISVSLSSFLHMTVPKAGACTG